LLYARPPLPATWSIENNPHVLSGLSL